MLRPSFRFLVFIIILSLASCGEPEAQTDQPKSYNQSGLLFSYPGNWKTQHRTENKTKKIIVESPGNTIVLIMPAPRNYDLTLKQFAEEFSKSANQKTPITSVRWSYLVPKKQNENAVITEKLNINLLGVNIPHTRIYRRKILNNKPYFIIAQFSDEDRGKIIKGVNLISRSLKRL